ncbi:MAG TPA: TonB-dependent receptor plug domain-containing protein, partial [Arenibacter sp.]|nr:TonB-dependent receptor plug domain-containing protein [Arenibacter sp.]
MKKIILSILLTFTGIKAVSQNSLAGKVTDKSNNGTLEQVSVYFPDLEKGSVSNQNGEFVIQNLPLGTYKLVASYIGYQSYSGSISILKGENRLDLELLPTAIEMDEVIVSTPFHKLQRDNVMKVEYAKVAALKTKGATTLAEGITDIPGVSVVSTGTGIGKPVIRGLTSNRVLVYAQGIRLENQQFGDEHGLGVNDAGIESVEVIKGPASLLYGSDAMGGVLYLNPEKFSRPNTTEGDINLNYFSNTKGLDGNIGVRTSGNRFKYLVRATSNSHTDYRTGDREQVTNSRFRESDLKLGTAYQSTSFKTELRYNYNTADLGIPEELGLRTNTRKPDIPYQTINNHILSSKSNLFFNRSSLELTLGYILNNRKEYEEAASVALDMDLSTFNYDLQYTLPKWKKLESIIGIQGIHQTNTNFGEEVLIPDAITHDIGVLAT